MITGQYGMWQLYTDLLAYISNELVGTPAGRPKVVLPVPGEIAWDECCEGLLEVTTESQYISDTITGIAKQNALQTDNCRGGWLITRSVITLLRCAPQPQSNAPGAEYEALNISCREVNSDSWVLLNSLNCYLQSLKDSYDIVDYAVAPLYAVGPDGECVGASITFEVALQR